MLHWACLKCRCRACDSRHKGVLMKITIGLFSLLLCLFVAGNTAHAFYQWVDENGNVHITDYPPPSKSAPEEPAAPEPAKPQQIVPPPPVATVPPPAPVWRAHAKDIG